MLGRELLEAVFARAALRCDPQRRILEALAFALPERTPARLVGLAVGKSALAMARGVGPVARGLVVALAPDGGDLPAGWRLVIGSHPEPDERSVVAGAAALALVASATPAETVIALVSGGASSLIEQPRIPIAEFRAVIGKLMAAAAPIAELNVVRTSLSAIKGGQLALACKAPIVTLVASDVVGDAMAVVGSGPTIGPWVDNPIRPVDASALAAQRKRDALAILARRGIPAPAALAALHSPGSIDSATLRVAARPGEPGLAIKRSGDRAILVAGIGEFAKCARAELATAGVAATAGRLAIDGDIADVADRLATRAGRGKPFVAYGEPTLHVPAEHGEGGRMQQLALELARRFRGGDRSALVAGTDGIDGPWPRHRPAPAGAFVDGATWDRILVAGRDPERALACCDAGTVLHAVDALFVPGPTGVNHADVVIVG